MDETKENEFYSSERLTALLPLPSPDAHKYSRGTLTVMAGSEMYPGAACLAATAGQRAGAGYTRVITEAPNVKLVQGYQASLVVRSWADVTPDELADNTDSRPCAYVIGCGFDPQSDPAARLVLSVIDRIKAPILIDGGGIAAVASNKGSRLLQRRFMEGLTTVLTPHGGEAALLAAEANLLDFEKRTRAHQAQSLAKMYGSLVVLKGPETYISDGRSIAAVRCGTPALAKAGTGDVLAGIVGALMAQRVDPFDAAVLGVMLHAQAGRAAAETFTEICVTPEDVVDAIPQAVRAIAAGLPEDQLSMPSAENREEAETAKDYEARHARHAQDAHEGEE